jgi:hypothetical protein
MSPYNIIHSIADKLFEAEERRINAMIVKLNQQNKRLSEAKVDGFLYNGQLYMPKQGSLLVLGVNQSKVPLHISLHSEMDKLAKDDKIVRDDRSFIIQTLFILLSPCVSKQDIRDTLPECIVDCAGDLQRLSRTREPAWSIQHNPRAIKQYHKLLPKLEIYAAARLIY